MWRNKHLESGQTVVPPTVTQKRTKKRHIFLKRLGLAVATALIFMCGVGVGNGTIQFTRPYSPVSGNLPEELDYKSVNEVYQDIRDNYYGRLTESQLLAGMKAGLADATKDPYTEYFTPQDAKSFNDQLNNSFSGIGAELSKDKDGNTVVIAPISGFPAAKAGLRAQDVIITVDGKSTTDMSLNDVVTKIRGKAGTTVKLEVVRNRAQRLDFTITRDTITVPSVTTEILDGDIGYIRISTFGEDTSGLIKQAAGKMKAAKVRGIILDMRDNPGGLLSAAVDVSSQWLPKGTTILQEKRGSTVVNTYSANGDNTLSGIRTVVLVNEGSASASEITAGALHDNKAATLIGVKTYGKGVVQQLLPLSDGGQLKVTIASWYRPNGQNINKKGITPDKIVKLSDKDITDKNDRQKTAALEFLRK